MWRRTGGGRRTEVFCYSSDEDDGNCDDYDESNDAWNPPRQLDLPGGNMNEVHKVRIQMWMRNTKDQRADYQHRVDEAIQDLWSRREGRKASRVWEKAELKQEMEILIAQFQAKIANLGEEDRRDEEMCHHEVASLHRVANGYYAEVDDGLEGAQQLLQLIDARTGKRIPKNQNYNLPNQVEEEEELYELMDAWGEGTAGATPPKNPPNELLCPITRELMVDPVMTEDGHTYERSAIERYFASSSNRNPKRSPATGMVLASSKLIPNIAIRSQCRDYMKSTTTTTTTTATTTITTTKAKDPSRQ